MTKTAGTTNETPAAGQTTPSPRRGRIIAFIGSLVVLMAVSNAIVPFVPRWAHWMRELVGPDIPVTVTFAERAALLQAQWWYLILPAAALLSWLAWRGRINRVLIPGVAINLLLSAVIALGSVVAWHDGTNAFRLMLELRERRQP